MTQQNQSAANQSPDVLQPSVDQHASRDASTLDLGNQILEDAADEKTFNTFNKEIANKEWESGTKEVLQQFGASENIKVSLNYNEKPGLQPEDLNDFAIGTGLLIAEAYKKNPNITEQEFLASISSLSSQEETKEHIQNLFGSQRNTNLGDYLFEPAPLSEEEKTAHEVAITRFSAHFTVVKSILDEINAPGFNPIEFMEKQYKDVVNHPDGVWAGTRKKGGEFLKETVDTAGDIWDTSLKFVKKNKGDVLKTVIIGGGVLYLAKLFFDNEEKNNSSGEEKGFFSEFFGGIGKAMKVAGFGTLGASLITLLWKGPEGLADAFKSIGNGVRETFEKTVLQWLPEDMQETYKKGKEMYDKAQEAVDEAGEKVSDSLEWLDEQINFDENKKKTISYLEEKGFDVPEWLNKISLKELAEAEGITKTFGMAGLAGFTYLIWKKIGISGLAINAGLYFFLVNYGKEGPAGDAFKNTVASAEEMKDDLSEKLSGEYPFIANLLSEKIDFNSLLDFSDNSFLQYAKENPITTIAAANAAWIFKGALLSFLKTTLSLSSKVLIKAFNHKMTTAGVMLGLFSWREEIITSIANAVYPEGKEKDAFLESLLHYSGEEDESGAANHLQDLGKIITEAPKEALTSIPEVIEALGTGKADFIVTETGGVLLHTLWDVNPIVLTGKMAINDVVTIYQKVFGDNPEENANTIWLIGEGVIFGKMAIEGARAIATLPEFVDKGRKIKATKMILKSFLLPTSKESRFVWRSVLSAGTFGKTRLDWKIATDIGHFQARLKQFDLLLSQKNISPEKIEAIYDDVLSMNWKNEAVNMKEVFSGIKGTRYELLVNKMMGNFDKDANKLAAKLADSRYENYVDIEEVKNIIKRMQKDLAKHKTIASNIYKSIEALFNTPGNILRRITEAYKVGRNPYEDFYSNVEKPSQKPHSQSSSAQTEDELKKRRKPQKPEKPLSTNGNAALKVEPDLDPSIKPKKAPVYDIKTGKEISFDDIEKQSLMEKVEEIAKKKNLSAAKKLSLTRAGMTLGRTLGYAASIYILYDIASADDPIEASAKNLVFTGTIAGPMMAGSAAGPWGTAAGAAIGIIATVMYGDEATEKIEQAMESTRSWFDKKGYAKQYYESQKGMNHALSFGFESAWDRTIGEWKKGEKAYDYFSETEVLPADKKAFGVQGRFFSIPNPIDETINFLSYKQEKLFRGEEKIENWNVSIREKIEDAGEQVSDFEKELSQFSPHEISVAENRYNEYRFLSPEKQKEIFELEKERRSALFYKIEMEDSREKLLYLSSQEISEESGWYENQYRDLYKEAMMLGLVNMEGVTELLEKNTIEYYHLLESFLMRLQVYKNMGVWERTLTPDFVVFKNQISSFVKSLIAEKEKYPVYVQDQIKNLEKKLSS